MAEPGISKDIVAPVLQALSELGLEVPLPKHDVVPGSSADALIDAAAVKLNEPALGLEIARRLPLGSLGMLDYALVTSPTLREGLERTARFYGLATQRVRLSLVEDAEHVTLVFERQPGVEHSRHWIEFAHGVVAERIRQTLGVSVTFDEVSFRHGPPAQAAAHDAFFGTAVQFSAPRDALGFPAALLAMPLRTASASLADVLLTKLKQLEPARAADELLVRVRRVIAELLDRQDPSLESAVVRLGMSRRTVQRALQRRGTSHQALLDEARRGLAHTLLDTGLTVAEVSERLGFSEPSAFFRAFRRWTGQSPKAHQLTRAPTAARR